MQRLEVHDRTPTLVSGYLELERARVKWMLSIDTRFVPAELAAKGQRTYRSMTVNGEEIEFSDGFTDLHTEVYRRTLAGEGFSLDDARTAIDIVAQMRSQALTPRRPPPSTL
ncbi:hypothetical protein ACFP81_14365 [Deinococcus lacus]|uniref:Oxidoreductase n=1 Tax=Deinococcus lacus TaxID=392561 RepID=A0ABW1YJM7_9DEIO